MVDPDEMIKAMEMEDRFIKAEHAKLHSEGIQGGDPDDPTPLEEIDCSDPRAVMRNMNLPTNLRMALGGFLNQYKARPRLQSLDEREMPARMSLLLVCGGELGVKTPLCGTGNWPCRDLRECPQCQQRLKATPLYRDYQHVFPKAKFHYAVTPSFTCDPKSAGVVFVTSKRKVKGKWKERRKRYNPFAGAPKGIGLTVEDDILGGNKGPVAACFRVCLSTTKSLVRAKLFDGAVVTHEIAWHFMRDGQFDPHVTPNAHAYANSSRKLTFEAAIACYDILLKEFCREALGKQTGKRRLNTFLNGHASVADAYESLDIARRVYPVLHVSPMLENDEIRHWLYYTVKCHKFVAEYQRAIAAGVSKRDLNEFMRDQVFGDGGGTTILGAVNSPRRYGNLRFRADKVNEYLGDVSRVLNRKTARHEQRERREARKKHEERPPAPAPAPAQSPLESDMDRQAMEEIKQAFRDEQDARNAMNRDEQEDASSGHNPS